MEFLASHGATLSVTPHLDYTSFSLVCLSKFGTTLVPWVTRLLWQATLPPEEVERERAKKRQSLLVDLEKTSYLASIYLRRGLFGNHHAYGQSLSLEDLEGLSRETLVQQYRVQYQRTALTVVMSGDIPDTLLGVLEEALQEGPAETVPLPTPLPTLPEPQHPRIPRPGVQATLRAGKVSLTKSHPDYHNLKVVNELLGGYFGSRLMQNLREDKGLTYGIYSSMVPLQEAFYLSIGADVKRENAELALQEIEHEVKLLQSTLVPGDELMRVKTHMEGKILGQLTSPFAHAEVFKGLHFYGLDGAHFQALFTTLQEITPETVQRVAQEHLVWEDMTTVLVGVAD